MTTLTIHSDSGDQATHREAVGKDGTPEAGQPLGRCVVDTCRSWPCGYIQRYVVGDLIDDHPYRPVAGHPDDDECTHRSDGSDATYCGEPRAVHQVSI